MFVFDGKLVSIKYIGRSFVVEQNRELGVGGARGVFNFGNGNVISADYVTNFYKIIRMMA